MEKEQLLRQDKHYYGEYGQKWLSASDCKVLLNNPRQFRQKQPTTAAMLQGSYLHAAILEPHKLDEFTVVDSSSRATKLYKEQSGGELALLAKEVADLERLAIAIKANAMFSEAIYQEGAEYEQPKTGDINGYPFKGKADVVTPGNIIDLKTTSDLSGFRYSAKKYGYDVQAYVYFQLWGKPVDFYVVEKSTANLGIFYCSDEFIESGRQKVAKALETYERFYGLDAYADINQWVQIDTL